MSGQRCVLCRGPLDDPARPVSTLNCGGDCQACMAATPDPDALDALWAPTVAAAVELVAGLDGTGSGSVPQVVARLRGQARDGVPVAVDAGLLADLVEAACDGGSPQSWQGTGMSRRWWHDDPAPS